MSLQAIGGKYQILVNMGFTERTLKKLTLGYDQRAAYRSQSTSINAIQTSIAEQETSTNLDEGFVYQEVFTADGVTKSYQVTENNGTLPETTADIMVTRNGLFLNSSYIASLDSINGTIELTFVPDNGDRIVVIWFYRSENEQAVFQEVFTPSGSATFTVTKNEGVLPSSRYKLFAYINGIFLDYEKFSDYNPGSGQFTLDFIPDTSDSIAAVWFKTLPESTKVVQETFSADGTQTTFTVTKNGGKLGKVKDAILLMRNGQHINNDYITGINPTSGTITLTFAPDQGDDITLIWFVEEFVTPSNSAAVSMFQEEFTADGTTPTFTVTENEGKLPESLSAIMVYRNGQFISNQFISSHDSVSGTITFGFVPRSGEKITIIWVVSNL